MWNERYAEAGFAYGTEPNAFLAEQVHRLPPGRVLDLGAGEGRNGVWLAQRGYSVLCVDGSDVGLAKARALARERGVSIDTEVADLATYAIAPAAFTVIVSSWCHLPAALRAKVHAACVAGLQPGGVLVLEAYTPAQLQLGTGGPKEVSMLPTLATLRDELAGLDFEVGLEREREVHEGRFHGGRSAVVQVVARKPLR
ncbi:MAG: class I SAM-dependent methyltransferase [Archangiaceae bacterium]|nr:class I SAM-dependent methyltransferase [Archangiaceae bacterium]